MIVIGDRKHTRTATEYLIIINVIFFILEVIFGEYIIVPLALIPERLIFHYEIWRLITHMFLHADFLHIFFNMYALYFFGRYVENYYGKRTFLLIYFVSGIFAGIFFSIVSIYAYHTGNVYALGASGAVFGVMATFAFTFPDVELYWWFVFIILKMKAKYFALIYATMELLRAIFIGPAGNVAYAAHVGGFIAGLFMTWLVRKMELRRASKRVIIRPFIDEYY